MRRNWGDLAIFDNFLGGLLKVKKENAKAMAEELGATLLAAIEGNHDDETVADTNL